MNIFSLKQDHTAALDKADNLVAVAAAASRDLTESEMAAFNRHTAEADKLAEKINAAQRRSTLHANMGLHGGFGLGEPAPEPKTPARTAPTSLREAMRSASPADAEQVRALGNYLNGDMTALADLRPTGDGGVFIPTMVAGVVARNYYAFTPVRNISTIWPTENGDPTTFPVVSDSESAVILAPAALTGADDTVSGDTPPTAITGPLMGAFKFSSKPVFCPREIVTDANLNVLEEILSALLARIGRTQNLKFTSGTGVAEPTGFLHDATAYSAGAVPLDLDVALDLAYAVPAMYRPQGVYMATDLTIKYLRKLKTGLAGDKRNLWDAFEEGNATLGVPAKLHGYSIIVNNDLPSVSPDGTFAGVSPLVFGDFRRFVIRDAEQGAPFVYRYPVPAKDGSAVVAFQRADSKLVVNTAIAKLTV